MSRSRYTLGIHLGHDRGASLVRDGVLHAHLPQDRLDRVKHSESPEIPFDAIDALLAHCGIRFEKIRAVGVSFVNVEIARFTSFVAETLQEHYSLRNLDVFGVPHHLAHALSTYHTSDLSDPLILVADGAGDAVGGRLESETAFVVDGGELEEVARRLHDVVLDIPGRPFLFNYALMAEEDRRREISLAKKYEQFTNMLGFGHFQDGKTMGLASYGRPLFDVAQYDFGGLGFSLTLADLLDRIDELRVESGLSYARFVRRERANLAATAQRLVERAVHSVLQALHAQFPRPALCLAGGLFLNCVANQRALAQLPFSDVHVVPAAGDDGQSVGAALEAWRRTVGRPKRTSETLPYLGPGYTTRQITGVLRSFNLTYSRHTDEDLIQHLVESIVDGKVVAVFRGRSEMGPRALCHRSILCDPRRPGMKRHLNRHVKFREAFRPYAPVVAAEEQHDYFDLMHDSPFMLLAGRVRPPFRRLLPAITHVDKTARVQAVERSREPFIHGLLMEFKRRTSIPILLNTSFNVAGEPIVERPHDAVATFLATGIDVLAVEDCLIDKCQNTTRL